MKPKKNIKKHNLVEPKWTIEISQRELIDRINEISAQIHRNTTRGLGNWVVMGFDASRMLDEAMEDYENVNVGDWRVEDDRHIQDITITPTRSVEYLDLDFNVLPSGGQFYTGTTQEGQEPWSHL